MKEIEEMRKQRFLRKLPGPIRVMLLNICSRNSLLILSTIVFLAVVPYTLQTIVLPKERPVPPHLKFDPYY